MPSVYKIIEAGINSAKDCRAKSVLENITTCDGYAEPGYEDPKSGIICFGDWNSITQYDRESNKFITIDNTPARVAELLEKAGAAIEWEDEWTTCMECGKAMRTSPDSYSWQPSYHASEDGFCCENCIDPEEVLESLEGKSKHCLTLDIDPADHGYIRLNEDSYENGLYGGQDADPKAIAEVLREMGVERFLFRLDSTGQFDIDFSVYVHESEIDLVNREEFSMSDVSGVDPADMLKKALQSAPVVTSEPGKVNITKVDLSTGTATTKSITAEEFVDGKALDS